MLKKIFFILVITISSVYGYKVGDSLDSKTIKELNLNKNKIYVLDFFASWCSSCKIELPLISKYNNSIDKNKYKIIGINTDEDITLGKEFVKELDLKFEIYYDNSNTLIAKFAPIGVPAIYYIKNNKIAKVVFGAVHNIDKKIKQDLIELEK